VGRDLVEWLGSSSLTSEEVVLEGLSIAILMSSSFFLFIRPLSVATMAALTCDVANPLPYSRCALGGATSKEAPLSSTQSFCVELELSEISEFTVQKESSYSGGQLGCMGGSTGNSVAFKCGAVSLGVGMEAT
jgi:hypothetical protein